jgi:hypothetical protein
MPFNRKLSQLRTLVRLGVKNVARVGIYRVGLKSGFHPAIRARGLEAKPPFFYASNSRSVPYAELDPNPDWLQQGCWFGKHRFEVGDAPPDWFQSPFTGKRLVNPARPWWKIQDFDRELGDIKEIWELSRLDWVLALTQRSFDDSAASRKSAFDRLNRWLENWVARNPCYQGPNWKCGQEAAIRVLHLIVATHFLDQLDKPTEGLLNLIESHLVRIAPTISYAVGQSNNHATSEAVAMFIAGDWLAQHGRTRGGSWSRLGRYWLDDRAQKLIGEDGTFSQYSVNYHRLMLDTYSLAIWWQQRYSLPLFDGRTQKKLDAAINWLAVMVDSKTGDAPNIGHNDGANLLPLTSADYRDYRPAVNLASFLLRGNLVFADSKSRDHLQWLGLKPSPTSQQPESRLPRSMLGKNGFCVLGNDKWKAVFRYPDARYRPSQADALHLDLWMDGENILRDAGSYSYFLDQEIECLYNGTAAHNTVQFDQRDQMPRLGRFLYGSWLATSTWKPPQYQNQRWSVMAGYQDWCGASHCRSIQLSSDELVVEDQIGGFQKLATLRWRLIPGSWSLSFEPDTIRLRHANCILTIHHENEISRAEIVDGWESRYYREKSSLPALEVDMIHPGTLTTCLTRVS